MIEKKIILTEEELRDIILAAMVNKTDNEPVYYQASKRAKRIMEEQNENNSKKE